MNYESWRISFQSSESAARQAFKLWQEALAQPAQEPVAWTDEYRYFLEWDKDSLIDKAVCKDTEAIPLYIHPAQLNGMDKPLFARVVPWQGLSDDEIKRNATKLGYLWTENSEISFKMDGFLELFARAIEQALKERNS